MILHIKCPDNHYSFIPSCRAVIPTTMVTTQGRVARVFLKAAGGSFKEIYQQFTPGYILSLGNVADLLEYDNTWILMDTYATKNSKY